MRYLVLFVLMFACSKQSTSFEITVYDLGNKVSQAPVTLFGTFNDLIENKNQLYPAKFTSSDGKVTFDNIEARQYFFKIKKGCLSNRRTFITTANLLEENKLNKLDVSLHTSGYLILNNTSNNPYRVFINETPALDVPGKSTHTEEDLETGSYSVRVVQLSGYVLFPTDQTFNVNIFCGEIEHISFPK